MSNGFCTTGLRRVALLAVMAFFVALAAACGGEGEQDCADNESWAADRDGTNACLLQCEDDDVCDDGRSCDSRGLCTLLADGDGDGGDGDGGTGDGDPDGDGDNDDPDLELCQDYCYLIYGCVSDTCTGINAEVINTLTNQCVHGDPQDATDTGCVGDLAAGQGRSEYEGLVYGDGEGNIGTEKNTCDDTKWLRCGPFGLTDACGCSLPTSIGDGCSEDADCDNGDLLFGECATEWADETEIEGGMCLIGTCGRVNVTGSDATADVSADGGCGAGNVCVTTPASGGGTFGLCEDTCDGPDDCRDGFACQILGEMYDFTPGAQDSHRIGYVRSCSRACTDDESCGDDSRCNDETGVCEFECGDADDEAACGELSGVCTDIEGTEYCVLDGPEPEPVCTEENEETECPGQVCDEDANGGLGECVDEADDTVCTVADEETDCTDADFPRCDEDADDGAGVCVECVSDDQCDGNDGSDVCNADNECEAAAGD